MRKYIFVVLGLVVVRLYVLGSETSSPSAEAKPPGDRRDTWEQDFLSRIGNDNPSPEIVGFVIAWKRGEGTDAAFNPLATTQPMDGDSCFNYIRGRCGVRNYPSYDVGMDATVKTLTNGFYPHLLHGLQTNDIEEALNDEELGTWGTGSGAVARNYNEWLSTQPNQPVLPTGNDNAVFAPNLQVAGTGCLDSNVTSAYVHSPGLQQIDIGPGEDWSFNDHWHLADDLVYCSGQNFTGGGVCNLASRYSYVARSLGLQVQSQYHGYVYDPSVPVEDNIAIMSSGTRGGQDLVITNLTNQAVHISSVLLGGQVIVSGSFVQ